MGEPARKPQRGGFSYADYLTWPEEERWELFDGEAFDMTPAPSRQHQSVLGKLHLRIGNHLEGKPCQVYLAPFDVRLPEHPDDPDERVRTVVQPDLVVFCERQWLDERGAKGPPTIAVEIISPRTAKKDLRDKFLLYERVGVRQYWVVQPLYGMLTVYELDAGGCFGRPQVYTAGDRLHVELLGDLEIEVAELFAD